MKNNRIIAIFVGIFVLLVAGIFGLQVFSSKKTVSIALRNSVSEISSEKSPEAQKTEENTQNAEPEKNEENKTVQELESNKQADVNKNSDVEDIKSDNKIKDSGSTGKIVDKLISWGFEESNGRKIDTIVVHSSYDALGDEPYDVNGLLAEYKQYGVSAHYLISRGGEIYRLVEDKNIAYHAGESKVLDGRTGVNAFSIGIEMMNIENGKFTEAEYLALNQLIVSLKKQYSIKYVLGHKDISPGRKTDPWGIEWEKVKK